MASVLLKFIPVHEKTIYEVALTVNYLECRVEMLVQVNKNTNTLMLAILHYLDSCVFCIYRLCHNGQTKSVQTVPTVLYWVLMASGTSFVQSLVFKKSTHLCKTCTAVTDVFLLSSLLLLCTVQDCTVLQRKAMKGALGTKISSLLNQFNAQFLH